MSRVICLLPLGILTFATTANATDFFEEHSGWTVFSGDQTCAMTMDYEGEGATQLLLSKSLDGNIKLFVGNYSWSAKEKAEYEIIYVLNGTSYSGKSYGFKSNYRSGFVASFDESFGLNLAKGNSLDIYMDDEVVDQLSLSGSAKAVGAVDRCLAKIRNDNKIREREEAKLAHIPKDPFAPNSEGLLAEPVKVATKPPSPRNVSALNQRMLEDYPRRAAQEGWQGTVGVLLKINQDGRVAECTVSRSSGHTTLDEAACVGFQRYARFEPASDEYGKPVEGSYSTQVNYRRN